MYSTLHQRNSLNRQWRIQIKLASNLDMNNERATREVNQGRYLQANHTIYNPKYEYYHKSRSQNQKLINEFRYIKSQLGSSSLFRFTNLYYVVIAPTNSYLHVSGHLGIDSKFIYENGSNPFKLINNAYTTLRDELFIIREHQENNVSMVRGRITDNNQDNLIISSTKSPLELKTQIHKTYQKVMGVSNNVCVEPIRDWVGLKKVISYINESSSQFSYAKHVNSNEYKKLHQFQSLARLDKYHIFWAINNSIKGITLLHTKRQNSLYSYFNKLNKVINEHTESGSNAKNDADDGNFETMGQHNHYERRYQQLNNCYWIVIRVDDAYSELVAKSTTNLHTTSSSIVPYVNELLGTKNTAQVLQLWRFKPT